MRSAIYRSFFLPSAYLLLMALICESPAYAQTSKRPSAAATANIITAGESVGQVKMGDTIEHIFQLYPKIKRNEFYHSENCPVGELNTPNSLRLYIRDNRVIQIAVQSNYPRATPETAEKILPGSTPEQVRKYYPNANKAFTKLGSASTSSGYAPSIFWVDQKAGIAFEFYIDQSRGRVVDKIHIFSASQKMIFGSSCESDEDLRELPPFDLKVPEKMIREYENQ